MHILDKFHLFNKIILLGVIALSYAQAYAQPEAISSVTIQLGEAIPEGCIPLGKVKGSSKETEVNEDHTPFVDRLLKARNNLRNEAHKLGGNTVHIIHTNNSGKYEIPGADKEIIFIGNVYRCD